MVALFGLPGSSLFSLVWVPTRSKGEQILDALAKPETQATLNARRESKVISDRAARKLRWNSGARIWDGSKDAGVLVWESAIPEDFTSVEASGKASGG